MNFFQINKKQFLPIGVAKAWDFFSDPKNLCVITPDYMNFKIIHSDKRSIYPGQIIKYSVSPLLGIRMIWVTEITNVKKGSYFVDEQRFGPYSFWHHKHFIREIKNGVEIEDIVDYKVPYGLFGKLLHRLIIKSKLDGIFDYRYNKLHEIFGEYSKTDSYTRNENLKNII